MSEEKIDGRKNNRGIPGKAGRRKVEDKADQVLVSIRASQIEALGGKASVREICNQAIQIALKNISK